jgi:hypothetical protein
MAAGLRWNAVCSFAAGLTLGLATTVGYMLGSARPTANSSIPEMHLKAMSGYGSENFAMLTGPVDSEAEGVFLLDYTTGDLSCYVINPRTGTFGAGFKRNVVLDLKVEKGKKPAFLLSTGVVQFRGFPGPQRPSNCVAYVCDANTGRFGAYIIPWTPGAFAAGALQINEMKLLTVGDARGVEVRE